MTNQQLETLHQLAKSCPGGVRGCEWWDDWVLCLWKDGKWYYGDERCCADMKPQHALDLITASADRWLVGKGWEIHRDAGGKGYEWWINSGENYLDKCLSTLPEALKYAMEQTKEEGTQ